MLRAFRNHADDGVELSAHHNAHLDRREPGGTEHRNEAGLGEVMQMFEGEPSRRQKMGRDRARHFKDHAAVRRDGFSRACERARRIGKVLEDMRKQDRVNAMLLRQDLAFGSAIDANPEDILGLPAGFGRGVATADLPAGRAKMLEMKARGAADFVNQPAPAGMSLGQPQEPLGAAGRRCLAGRLGIKRGVVRELLIMLVQHALGRRLHLIDVAARAAMAAADLKGAEPSQRKALALSQHAVFWPQSGQGAKDESGLVSGMGFPLLEPPP